MSQESTLRDRRARIVLVPIAIFLLLVVVLALLVFQAFILDFVVAASIALLLSTLQRRMTRAFRGRAWLAAALLVLLTTVVIFVPILSSLLIFGNQTGAFLTWLRPRLTPAELQKLLDESLPARYPWLATWLDLSRSTGVPLLADALQRLSAATNGLIQAAIARFAAALLDTSLFLLMLFFLLRDGPSLRNELRNVSPFSAQQESEIVDHVARTVRGVLQAMVVVPIAQGVLAGLGFWYFGVPSPLAWGVAVVFAAFVPILGSPLGWVPAAVYLFNTGPPRPAIGLTLYGIVVISGIDNLIKPLILRGAAQIHPLLGFLSILGGMLAFGPLGFLVGPVVLSLVISAIRIYRDDVLARARSSGLTPPEGRT
jgi:predicted PurR-regulated permease PerM